MMPVDPSLFAPPVNVRAILSNMHKAVTAVEPIDRWRAWSRGAAWAEAAADAANVYDRSAWHMLHFACEAASEEALWFALVYQASELQRRAWEEAIQSS